MDELQERMARIFSFIRNWCEFLLLLVLNALMTLILIIVWITLVVTPIVFLFVVSQQHGLFWLFLYAVFGGVAAYVYFRTNTAGDKGDPPKGRPINSQDQAIGNSIEQETSR